MIDTPGFVPVATTGVLKYVDMPTAEQLGTQLIFCNTFHLLVHPGADAVAEAGGLHRMAAYSRPLITDSGGFQVFSMSTNESQDELKGKSQKKQNKPLLISNKETGVKFRSYLDGHSIELTPESSVEAQKAIGADIIIPLDILLPYNVKERKMLEMFHRTHRWEARSLQVHLQQPKQQAMYSVLHGGVDRGLRKVSVDYLTRLPFQGHAIGGSLGKTRQEMEALITYLMPLIPREKPVHLLGIGDIESITQTLPHGIDTYDSAYPTKAGRHGQLFSE